MGPDDCLRLVSLQSQGTFSFRGIPDDGRMGAFVYLNDGSEQPVVIPTACSAPIGPGVAFGDRYLVLNGRSRAGGDLACQNSETASLFPTKPPQEQRVTLTAPSAASGDVYVTTGLDRGSLGSAVKILADGELVAFVRVDCHSVPPLAPEMLVGTTDHTFRIVSATTNSGVQICDGDSGPPPTDSPSGIAPEDGGEQCTCNSPLSRTVWAYQAGTPESKHIRVVGLNTNTVYFDGWVSPGGAFAVQSRSAVVAIGEPVVVYLDHDHYVTVPTSCTPTNRLTVGEKLLDLTLESAWTVQGSLVCTPPRPQPSDYCYARHLQALYTFAEGR